MNPPVHRVHSDGGGFIVRTSPINRTVHISYVSVSDRSDGSASRGAPHKARSRPHYSLAISRAAWPLRSDPPRPLARRSPPDGDAHAQGRESRRGDPSAARRRPLLALVLDARLIDRSLRAGRRLCQHPTYTAHSCGPGLGAPPPHQALQFYFPPISTSIPCKYPSR